jgi:hypothetical protein
MELVQKRPLGLEAAGRGRLMPPLVQEGRRSLVPASVDLSGGATPLADVFRYLGDKTQRSEGLLVLLGSRARIPGGVHSQHPKALLSCSAAAPGIRAGGSI